MAALTSDQVINVYYVGTCGRTALYALKNVDGADTVDVADLFKVVKRAGLVSDSGTTVAAIDPGGIVGTVLTMPAGPNNDGCWLLVVGVAA